MSKFGRGCLILKSNSNEIHTYMCVYIYIYSLITCWPNDNVTCLSSKKILLSMKTLFSYKNLHNLWFRLHGCGE